MPGKTSARLAYSFIKESSSHQPAANIRPTGISTAAAAALCAMGRAPRRCKPSAAIRPASNPTSQNALPKAVRANAGAVWATLDACAPASQTRPTIRASASATANPDKMRPGVKKAINNRDTTAAADSHAAPPAGACIRAHRKSGSPDTRRLGATVKNGRL